MDKAVHVRWMIRRDLPDVLKIENQSFEFPWSEQDYVKCMRQRNCVNMVAEIDGNIVGHIAYELQSDRIHLLSLSVAPDFRKQGVGKAMVEKVVSKLSSERRSRILLEVRETNLDAQQFFKKLGFAAIATIKDFWTETCDDAYLLEYKYVEPEAVPAPVGHIGWYTVNCYSSTGWNCVDAVYAMSLKMAKELADMRNGTRPGEWLQVYPTQEAKRARAFAVLRDRQILEAKQLLEDFGISTMPAPTQVQHIRSV